MVITGISLLITKKARKIEANIQVIELVLKLAVLRSFED